MVKQNKKYAVVKHVCIIWGSKKNCINDASVSVKHTDEKKGNMTPNTHTTRNQIQFETPGHWTFAKDRSGWTFDWFPTTTRVAACVYPHLRFNIGLCYELLSKKCQSIQADLIRG